MKNFTDRFYTVFGTVIGSLILGVSLLLVIDALGRYVANRPLLGGVEISIILMSFIVFGSYAFAYHSGTHVRITVLTRCFPAKIETVENIFVCLLGLIFCSFITFSTWNQFWESWLIGETMRAPIELPRWLLKLALVSGFFLFTIQFLLDLIDHTRILLQMIRK